MKFPFIVIAVLALNGCGHDGRTPLERAVLTENWQAVIRLTDGNGQTAAEHVVRAHAMLASNRNDEAACRFGELTDTEELNQWAAWTENLASYSGNATARYLHGDALIRLGHYQAGLAELNKGVKDNGRHVLSLNARGVVHALQGDVESASEDFSNAVAENPRFVDAIANRAFLNIQQKRSAEGAMDDFAAAIKIAPFGLALAGRAYLEIALGNLAQGSASLEAASKQGCTKRFLSESVPDQLAWVSRKFGGAESDGQAGTTVSRRSTDVDFTHASQMIATGNSADVRRGVNMMATIVGNAGPYSAYAKRASSLYTALNKTDPGRAQQFAEQIHNGKSWNVGVDRVITALSAITPVVEGPRTNVGLHAGPVSISRDSGHVSVTVPFAQALKPIANVTEINSRGFSTLDRALSGVGGVTTSLAAASIDDGDWGPIKPIYALYPTAYHGGK